MRTRRYLRLWARSVTILGEGHQANGWTSCPAAPVIIVTRRPKLRMSGVVPRGGHLVQASAQSRIDSRAACQQKHLSPGIILSKYGRFIWRDPYCIARRARFMPQGVDIERSTYWPFFWVWQRRMRLKPYTGTPGWCINGRPPSPKTLS